SPSRTPFLLALAIQVTPPASALREDMELPNTGLAPGRILVVDDQAANLRVVTALLTRHGYEVLSASDGASALELASAQVPDLMLLDMMMPGMDGFELIARLKEQPTLAQVPVVFLTAAQD